MSRRRLRSLKPEDNILRNDLAEDNIQEYKLDQTIVEALESLQRRIMERMNAEERRREECRESEKDLNIKYTG